MRDEFSDCLVLNTVQASRSLIRRYDRVLQPHGVSVIQFVLLAAVRRSEGLNMTQLSERLLMDRTTLLRNIKLLVGRGLIEDEPVKRGRGRSFRLTDAGDRVLDDVVPLWRVAQAEMRQRIGEERAATFLEAIRTLSLD